MSVTKELIERSARRVGVLADLAGRQSSPAPNLAQHAHYAILRVAFPRT
ncbi:hypothetical protein [Xanthomonas arboricola]|nr:hypothetical protein [Xanthomonas arboricola]